VHFNVNFNKWCVTCCVNYIDFKMNGVKIKITGVYLLVQCISVNALVHMFMYICLCTYVYVLILASMYLAYAFL